MLLFLSICGTALVLIVALWRWHVHETRNQAMRKQKYDQMVASTEVKFPITVTVQGEKPVIFSNLNEAEGSLEYFDTDSHDGEVIDALNRRVKLKMERCWTEVFELEKEAV